MTGPASGAPRVSVLMSVRDAAPYLEASMRGVLAQTFADLELIVVDDGSADGSAAVAESVADPRVRVLRRPRLGIVAAHNAGLDAVRGELVARQDADDLLPPDRLARQVALLDRRPEVVACGTDYEMFGARTGVVRMPRTAAACRARLLFGTCVAHGTSMIRAAALTGPDAVRYREEYAYAEDYRLFSELAGRGDLVNLPYVGLRYRWHGRQVSVAAETAQRRASIAVALANLRRGGVADVDAAAVERMMWMDRRGAGAALDYLLRVAPGLVRTGARAAGRPGALTALQLVRERLNTALRAAA